MGMHPHHGPGPVPPGDPGLLLAIAVGGLLSNLLGLWLLQAHKDESLNVRGAWLHVLTDALGSVGAIVAGVLVWALGWNGADPAISVFIALLVIYSSWALLRESVAVLMESVPRGIDLDQVREALRGAPGVQAVHDLHVWTITRGMNLLSAHVVTRDMVKQEELLAGLRRSLRERFGIHHVTIQVEAESCPDAEMHD